MAMEAWARFSTATSRFIHISDSHMQAMQIALATSKDVILFFSYSGSTKDMEDIMNIAKARGIPIILITHFPNPGQRNMQMWYCSAAITRARSSLVPCLQK